MKKLIYIIALFPVLALAQTGTENYVKTTSYQQEFTIAQINNGTPVEDEKLESITYIDGMGRPKQSIGLNAGGDREDIVQYIEFDDLGREAKQYLPYAAENSGANYIPLATAKTQTLNFYNTFKYENTSNPYSENIFEKSPRSRVNEVGAPGEDWKYNILNSARHTIKSEYGFNSTNEVMQFSVSYTNQTADPQLVYDGYFQEKELSKTTIKDENWQTIDGDNNLTQTFTNKSGQLVLKRQKVYDPLRTTSQYYKVNTYYIYDDYGNLIFVLSPLASGGIVSNGSLVQNYQTTILDKLSYQYKYDNRNRLIEKKIPGKGSEYIIYDRLDRPILTQDALLKADNNKWLFTKYDAFNRVAYTGIYTNPFVGTRQQLQDDIDLQSQNLNEEMTSASINIDGTDIFYTNNAHPSGSNYLEVLTINYYDDYIDHIDITNIPSSVFQQTLTTQTKGLPTVSKVRILETDQWITTYSAYDNKGRIIYIDSYNEYLDTRDKIKTKLDFTGKPLEVLSSHKKDSNTLINTHDYFYYDHVGRLLTHKQKIDNEPLQLISENTYDELGQLTYKNVGGETTLDGYTDLTNVDVTFDGVITKSGGAQSTWDAGAKTKGAITLNGGIKYRVLQGGGLLSVGLLKANQNRPNWNDGFDYGIYHSYVTSSNGEKEINLIINGVIQFPAVSSYSSGDRFSIERSGNQIIFKKNNISFSEIPNQEEEVSLLGKVGFKAEGAQISEFQIFGDAINKKLQNVSYKYNIRGWLTNVNSMSGFLGGIPDLFSFQINYNNVEASGDPDVVPLYNGNISQTFWKTINTNNNGDIRGYSYIYDKLNRITKATSYQGASLPTMNITNIHNLNRVSYDKNGNITDLSRNGSNMAGTNNDIWDNINYYYQGNQLVNVRENSTSTLKDEGFYDGNNNQVTGLDDYRYDLNGNMLSDLNKGITAITYNHLNLPVNITINNNTESGTISYIYDATGIKLKKILHIGNNAAINTEYAGNFIYSDMEGVGSMQLQFFNHSEGYIEPTVVAGTRTEKSVKGFDTGTGTTTYSDYKYVFQFKDHLGNIRLSYSDGNLDGVIDLSEIIEESNYYPFGLKQKGYNIDVTSAGNSLAQQWKYNGKQLDQTLGLETYDFGARNYDPTLGRWMNIDPLAEISRRWTPYNYAYNNPVFFIDPDGMEAIAAPDNDYGIDKATGNVSLIKETDDTTDTLFAGSGEGKSFVKDESKGSVTVDKHADGSSVISDLSVENSTTETVATGEDTTKERTSSITHTNDGDDAFNVFKFVADNSDVEWSLHKFTLDNGKTSLFQLGTYHDRNLSPEFKNQGGGVWQGGIHSHPNENTAEGRKASLYGDQGVGTWYLRKYGKNLPYQIYFPNTGRTTEIKMSNDPLFPNGSKINRNVNNFKF